MERERKIFADNFKRILQEQGKLAIEVSRDLNISQQAVSNWCNENACPRMNTLQRVADYLGVPKSALIEEYDPNREKLDRLYEAAKKLTPLELDSLLSYAEFLGGSH